MSYSCGIHGWQHMLNACPACSTGSIATGSSILPDTNDQPQKPSLYYEGMEDDNYLPPKPDATPMCGGCMALAKHRDALKARVAELEQDHKDDMREYGTMLDEIAAARADSKRLSDAIQDGIDNCCKHTDRIAELEGQLKAKVNLETVFVADSYEEHLTQANAEIEKWKDRASWADRERDMRGLEITSLKDRIAELELQARDMLEALNNNVVLADAVEEREQKLVAALEKIGKLTIENGNVEMAADYANAALEGDS